jgi:hypothetical protein
MRRFICKFRIWIAAVIVCVAIACSRPELLISPLALNVCCCDEESSSSSSKSSSGSSDKTLCSGCLNGYGPDYMQVDVGSCGDFSGTYLVPFGGGFCSYSTFCNPLGNPNDICCWYDQFPGCGGENVCLAVVIRTASGGGYDLVVNISCQARGSATAKVIANFLNHYSSLPDCMSFSAVSMTRTFGGQPTGCCFGIGIPPSCSESACDGTSATAFVTTP